ncbi:helix-turn-helix domain-containing protein [Macrococcus animalis]|uniref:helix-turn-helix domain-containing protein n=1 Tax=Macrococcus animalis TaxID=3395467 RepID=UPI0039BE7DBD
MKFGEVIREVRKINGFSLKELSRRASISPGYLSNIENGATSIPSVTIISKILFGLTRDINEKKNGHLSQKEIYEKVFSSEDLHLDIEEKKQIFEKANDILVEKINHIKSKADEYNNLYFKNKYSQLLHSDTPRKFTDEPVFDLEWLTQQRKYKVFYGRSYLVNKEDDNEYHVLQNEDLEIITNIIKAYIDTKYSKIKEPKSYFEEHTPLKNIYTDFEKFNENNKKIIKLNTENIDE